MKNKNQGFVVNEVEIRNEMLKILDKYREEEAGLSFSEVVFYRKLIKKSNVNETIKVVDSNGNLMYELALIDNIELHKMVNDNPKMDESEYETLKYSISINWQIEPVLVYRGKIVDGRHRYFALKELGIPVIKIEKLPNNLTLKEVREIVNAKNNQRRHMSKSQLAVMAYREWKQDGSIKKGEVAMKYGITQANLSYCERIENNLGSKVLDSIFETGKWTDGSGKVHKSLSSIVRYIAKIEKENEKKNKSTEPTVDEDVKDIFNKLELYEKNGEYEKLSSIYKKVKSILKNAFED